MRRATFLLRAFDYRTYRITEDGRYRDVYILDDPGTIHYGPSVDFPEILPGDMAALSDCTRRENAEMMSWFAAHPEIAEKAYDMGLLPRGSIS